MSCTVYTQVFDNDEFEVRSPDNWLSLAKDSDGNMVGLPARALFLQPDSTGQWRNSKVGKLTSLTNPRGLVVNLERMRVYSLNHAEKQGHISRWMLRPPIGDHPPTHES